MSLHNHNKPVITTAASSRMWSHLCSHQTEGIDVHSAASSGSIAAEYRFYSQPKVTSSPNQSTQMSSSKSSVNWHSSSALLSNSVDSPSKTTPLFNLQMLVDNKQTQLKNVFDKKDTFDLEANADTTNTCSKMGNQLDFNSKNADRILDQENNTAVRFSGNECYLLDSGLTSLASPRVANYDDSLNSEKEIISNTASLNYEDSKNNLNGTIHDKCLENDNSEVKVNFFPEVTIQKVTSEKRETDLIKDNIVEELGVIVKTKNVVPITNSVLKSNKTVKDDVQEFRVDIKKKSNEIDVKSSRNFLKKGKKGVDSLLEKLEICSKKYNTGENFSPTASTTNIDEKDSNSVRSMSPEYYKSRSPSNREDEVVSPNFSNDDSNDTKQRRKRKLGKPIRLSKDAKSAQEDSEFQGSPSKLIVQSEIQHNNVECNQSLLFRKSLSPSCSLKHIIQKKRLESVVDNNNEKSPKQHEKNENELKVINFKLRRESTFENQIKDEESTHLDNLSGKIKLKSQYKIDEDSDLLSNLRDEKFTRMRRSSECAINISNKNNQKRRRSCGDIKEFVHETTPKVNNENSVITFNEVESQLEKMFAGIIENDKDLLKRAVLEAEKSGSVISDEDQKENLTKKQIRINRKSNSFVSGVMNNDIHKNRRKKMTSIRYHKSKIVNSFKELSNSSDNFLCRDKKSQFGNKRPGKIGIMKKKKMNTNNDLRDSTYDLLTNISPTKSKGPVVQIKGLKHNPTFIQVVNVPREDDEERSKEKRKAVNAGNMGRSKRLNYQNMLDCYGKLYNTGLHNSTLSVRYDAHTADVTWICVFCKRGPHFLIPGDLSRPHPNVYGPHIAPGSYTVPAGVLSDLFGPYLIGKDCVDDNVMSPDEQEIVNEQKHGHKNKRSLRHAGLADQFLAKVSKRKKKLPNNVSSNLHMGMTTLCGEEQRWEVWLHEQCIIWATGVYITGGMISGLQEAVWDAAKTICNSCGLPGANIGCIKRGCGSVIHYCCALTAGWHLDIDQYIPKCNIHRAT